MLITPDFVFIHVPKTGGAFIKAIVERNCELVHRGDDHESARNIPQEFSGLPVLAAVRNPWDWYVSWYTYMLSLRDPSIVRPDGRERSFAETVTLLCDGTGGTAPRSRRWDLYSWQWWSIVGYSLKRGLEADVVRFEQLGDEFVAFLDRHEIAGAELRRAAIEDPPFNESDRGDYRDYYDAELRDVVGYYTRRLVRMYDYRF